MKKLLLIAITVFGMTSMMNAQNIGVTAGLNFANVDFEDFDTDSRTGFRAGVFAEFPLAASLYFEPSLLLNSKGAEIGEAELRPLYIDIPLLAKYKFEVGDINLYAKAGPYIGLGIGGVSEFNGEETDIEWGSEDEESNPLDLGLAIGAGVEFGKFHVGLGYDLGFVSINNTGPDAFNRVFHISAGYMLLQN